MVPAPVRGILVLTIHATLVTHSANTSMTMTKIRILMITMTITMTTTMIFVQKKRPLLKTTNYVMIVTFVSRPSTTVHLKRTAAAKWINHPLFPQHPLWPQPPL